MDPPNKIKDLQETIRVLESHRAILGEKVVDSSIAALHKEIAGLRPAYTDERKLVSILFCDIVGSSNIAADRDPEEVLNIVNSALFEMNLGVESFDGTITRYMGDGILAIFGAPKAQEHHAEQAVRAGLEIQKKIKVYAASLGIKHNLENFQVRVGINSGRVVGGGVGGEKGEYTVIGDAVNMAARFEAAAPPGGVLIGESTFQLAGGNQKFETQAWEPIAVKGSPKLLHVYQVLGTRNRSQSQVAANAPLIGRDVEISILQTKYHEVVAQERLKIIRIIGPAGIGKSRLRLEFISWLNSLPAPPRVSLGRALTYNVNTPFALASNLLNASFQIGETDPMEQRREKLKRGWKSRGALSAKKLYYLAEIMSTGLGDGSLDDLEPQARRDLIFESFIAYWKHKSQKNKLVLILEDTHLADALSLDLIEQLAVKLQKSSLLLVIFSRPDRKQDERQPAFQAKLEQRTFEEIFLQELDASEMHQFVQGLLKSSTLPQELIETIAGKAQGNPFFIEEIIASLLEDGSLASQNGDWVLTRDLAEIQVPDTVQGVIADRIDRLDPEDKQVLQHAAIIGRSFSQKVLANLLERETGESLVKLSKRDFIIRLRRATLLDDWEWLFRHVLVQEVAYESVLVEVRRFAHCRIANYLEQMGKDRLDELSPTLALHFDRGNIWDRAVSYLVRAAERSARVFALPEALNFYDRAIELAEAHSDDIVRGTLLNIYENRGDVRTLAYEFEGAEEDLGIVLEAARNANDRIGEQRLFVRLGFLYRTADRLQEAVKSLKAGLEVARERDDLRAVADTLYHLGTVAWTEGENDTALKYQREAVDICKQLGLKDLVAVQALHGLAEAQHWAGNPRQAVDSYRESIHLARLIGDKSYESENLYMLAYAYAGDRGTGDSEPGQQCIVEALEISRMAHLDGHTAPALQVAGLLDARVGNYQQGLDKLIRSLIWSQKLGVLRFQSSIYYQLGHLYRELNLFEKALAADTNGLQIAIDHGVGFNLHGLQAGLAIDKLSLGDQNVEQELLDAYEMAQRRGQWIHVVKCLEGLCERALDISELQLALGYSSRLEEIAKSGGMRDLAVRAQLLQAKAFTAMGEFDRAEIMSKFALEEANQIQGVRLQWDAQAALEKLYRAWGKDLLADEYQANVISIVSQIRENLQDDELKIGLPDYSN